MHLAQGEESLNVFSTGFEEKQRLVHRSLNARDLTGHGEVCGPSAFIRMRCRDWKSHASVSAYSHRTANKAIFIPEKRFMTGKDTNQFLRKNSGQHPGWTIVRILKPYILIYKKQILLALVCLVCAKLAGLLIPVTFKHIIDSFYASSSSSTLLVVPCR